MRYIFSIPALAMCAGAQLQPHPSSGASGDVRRGRGPGKEIASGAGDLGKGAAKAVGNLAKGAGQGALDLAALHPINAATAAGKGAGAAGKAAVAGAVKGAAKIGKGIGKAF